ncbi:hypothetical protein [Saccharothrix luteola]|uniref:hypothetical protein n=1 Tax=Saccharothrix luteola TaxID=2893018 RepID=UPI001E5EE200|nr:hypothetical protein [Saccharothrix luteola]MCC8246712.1 hypothetical protein [Saccharothrix luteola]
MSVHDDLAVLRLDRIVLVVGWSGPGTRSLWTSVVSKRDRATCDRTLDTAPGLSPDVRLDVVLDFRYCRCADGQSDRH